MSSAEDDFVVSGKVNWMNVPAIVRMAFHSNHCFSLYKTQLVQNSVRQSSSCTQRHRALSALRRQVHKSSRVFIVIMQPGQTPCFRIMTSFLSVPLVRPISWACAWRHWSIFVFKDNRFYQAGVKYLSRDNYPTRFELCTSCTWNHGNRKEAKKMCQLERKENINNFPLDLWLTRYGYF